MKQMHRVFVTVLVLSVQFLFTSCGSKAESPALRGGGGRNPGMTVSGVIVTLQPLDNVVNSSGTVLASESVDLAAEASGTVKSILFREGQHVSKNDLLVKINDEDLQAQLRKTQLQMQLAADQAERQKRLYETGNTAKEQYDIAVSTHASLKADIDNLVASIRKREIRAPFDGVVGLRYVSEGSYVAPNTRIASIQKINPLKVDFAVPEKYAGKVHVGDSVRFTSEESSLQFKGRVYAIEPQIEPSTRTVQIRALCDNKAEAIFPGGYVNVELRLRQTGGALMVPTQAIIPVLKGQTVFVRKNGVVAVVPVKTGLRTPSAIQITEGLAAGDTVLTTGILQVRPGMPVNVQVKQ